MTSTYDSGCVGGMVAALNPCNLGSHHRCSSRLITAEAALIGDSAFTQTQTQTLITNCVVLEKKPCGWEQQNQIKKNKDKLSPRVYYCYFCLLGKQSST